jgi:hypothetical protein
VLGRAVTHGQALPLGRGDPIIASRAVRRALAAAGRRALEVGAMVVATRDVLAADVPASFARRALGPPGERVAVRALRSDEPDAARLADLAAIELSRVGMARDRIVMAVGIGPDGTTVALCLGEAHPGDRSERR